MIRRTRRSIITITMILLTVVLLVPLVALNFMTTATTYNQTRSVLSQIAEDEASLWNSQVEPRDAAPLPASAAADDDYYDDADDDDVPQNDDNDAAVALNTETTNPTTTPPSISTAKRTTTIPNASTSQKKTTAKNNNEAAPVESSAVPNVTTAKNNSPNVTTTAAAQTTANVATTKTTTVATTRTTTKATTKTTTIATTKKTTAPASSDPNDPPRKTTAQNKAATLNHKTPDDAPDYVDYNESICSTLETKTTTATPAEKPRVTEKENLSLSINATAADYSDSASNTARRAELNLTASRYGIDYCFCHIDTTGTLSEYGGTVDWLPENLQTMIDHTLADNDRAGYLGNYQYVVEPASVGNVLVFSDQSAQRAMSRRTLLISIALFVLMEVLVLVFTIILTKRAMRPVYDAFDRQRQFISDAGHELKTPLTIITTNADILHDEIGENKWLGYIQTQTERMRGLITDMMDLTKLDIASSEQREKFSLSDTTENAALPFESSAFEQNKNLVLDIAPDVMYTGDASLIEQLITIFIDNAIKYSNDGGTIRVTLSTVKDKPTLEFYNTGEGVTDEERDKIFERFYRADSARSTGGYGLGLSIAKSIMDAHKIRIHIDSEPHNWIKFTLTF